MRAARLQKTPSSPLANSAFPTADEGEPAQVYAVLVSGSIPNSVVGGVRHNICALPKAGLAVKEVTGSGPRFCDS